MTRAMGLRAHRDEEQQLLAAWVTMTSSEHKFAGPSMHDRIIGALETCCRRVKSRTVTFSGLGVNA